MIACWFFSVAIVEDLHARRNQMERAQARYVRR
uniref:Uncharacterized protein n=1 Tax=Arundo donax TaxID=35708 RepID=A0A0A9D2N5_ARUDO